MLMIDLSVSCDVVKHGAVWVASREVNWSLHCLGQQLVTTLEEETLFERWLKYQELTCPTAGRDPYAGSGNWYPRGCSGMKSCNSSRVACGRRHQTVRCKTAFEFGPVDALGHRCIRPTLHHQVLHLHLAGAEQPL